MSCSNELHEVRRDVEQLSELIQGITAGLNRRLEELEQKEKPRGKHFRVTSRAVGVRELEENAKIALRYIRSTKDRLSSMYATGDFHEDGMREIDMYLRNAADVLS